MEHDFQKLEDALRQSKDIPGMFLFKFIIPNNNETLAQTMQLFDNSADVVTRESSNGKYVSISSKEVVISVEDVIEKYKLAANIKGLIFL